MEIKIEATGPAGCGKTKVIRDIEDCLVQTYGRCAVQTKDWSMDDHSVTFVVYQEDAK